MNIKKVHKIHNISIILLVIVILVETWIISMHFGSRVEWKSQPPAVAVESPTPKAPPAPVHQGVSSIPLDGKVEVTKASDPIFAYAHGTVQADGKFFVGMASRAGNPFATNEIIVFADPADMSKRSYVSLPFEGDVETMVYDSTNDKVYFDFSSNGGLHLYGLDPHSLHLTMVASSTVDAGRRPSIVTDGTYIYGITETDPSTVFKVRISDGSIATSTGGHIPIGHSAAIGIYASTTELYFGGGQSDKFEKVRASDLVSLAQISVAPCLVSDDMLFRSDGDGGGHVYIGCETTPIGKVVNTSDMTISTFPLPEYSYGLFEFDGTLYNTAHDSVIDVFPNFDLAHGKRYGIMEEGDRMKFKGQDISPNELFFSTSTDSLYFTGWWGLRGLYQIRGLSSMH